MNVRVLFLEDDDDAAEALTAAMEAHHASDTIHVERADTLAGALRVLRSLKPDVAVIDLGLPDSEGLRAPYTLRAAAPELPIVVWTGHDSEHDALDLIRDGIQDYLVKGDASANRVCQSALFAIRRKQRELGTRPIGRRHDH